jgi:hypothetical protein
MFGKVLDRISKLKPTSIESHCMFKKHNPCFEEEHSKLLHQRGHAKL